MTSAQTITKVSSKYTTPHSTQWYTTRGFSWPEAPRTVVEGTCFAHQSVAQFATVEMAERAVRAVNAFEPMLEALRIAEARLLEIGSLREGDRDSLEAYAVVCAAIAKAEGPLCRGGAPVGERS